jgi:phosphoglycolate phosphatase
MIRCVAFDFDGTLVDSNLVKRQMFDEVVSGIEGGAELMAEVLRETTGDRYTVFVRFVELTPRLPRASGDRHDQPWRPASVLADDYTRRCEEAISMCPEIPGATALLERLKARDILTAVNSATPRDALVAILERRGWGKTFAHVLGAPAGKAENLVRLAARTRLDLKEIAMVGDREEDRSSAVEAGCHFVGLKRADSTFTVPPERFITELAQLPDVLGSLGAGGIAQP